MTSVASKDAIGNPQIEDGHTRIANELLEAITRFDFSKRQLKVVLFVIRKTYGYNKKVDQMSISQISAGTGLNHSATVNAVNELVELGVVSKQYGQHAQLIGLIKKYQTWGVVSKQYFGIKTIPEGVSKQQLGSIKTIPTKDKPKNNTKRKVAFSLPDFVPVEAWDGFVAMRQKIKKPMTERAMTIAINKLEKLHKLGHNVAEVLDQSTLNSWQDIYEPKTDSKQSQSSVPRKYL